MKKFIKILFAAVAVFSLASCLKDDNYDNGITGHDLPNVPKVIEIGYLADPANTRSFAYDLVDAPVTATLFYARLASGQPATEDITITLDTTGGYARVRAEGLTLLPASFYTHVVPSFKIVIPKGQREAAVKINTNAIQFNPASTYGLFFRVASVEPPGYVISASYREFIAVMSAKNAYDGKYSVISGNVQRYSAPGVPTVGDALNGSLAGNGNVTLVTTGANSNNIVGLGWSAASGGGGIGGIDGLYLTVDPVTNLVTVRATGNATLANKAGLENKYDPVTRTFTLNFWWNPASTTREYSIVMTYSGPR